MSGSDPASSRQDIADLVHRYALAVRRRDIGRLEALFTLDMTFEVREIDFVDPVAVPHVRARTVGRAGVIAHIARSMNGVARVCPTVSNLLIDVSGEMATANCLMSSWIWPGDGRMIGEYDDGFRYEAGQWRFCSRVYTILSAGVDGK